MMVTERRCRSLAEKLFKPQDVLMHRVEEILQLGRLIDLFTKLNTVQYFSSAQDGDFTLSTARWV